MLTLLVSWVSIMKLWTCFSALVSSNFLDTTATSKAVQPAPSLDKTQLYKGEPIMLMPPITFKHDLHAYVTKLLKCRVLGQR